MTSSRMERRRRQHQQQDRSHRVGQGQHSPWTCDAGSTSGSCETVDLSERVRGVHNFFMIRIETETETDDRHNAYLGMNPGHDSVAWLRS